MEEMGKVGGQEHGILQDAPHCIIWCTMLGMTPIHVSMSSATTPQELPKTHALGFYGGVFK